MMETSQIEELAKLVDQAAVQAKATEQLSQIHQFDVDDSYAIQALSLEQRYERGEELIGLKMGFTSEAKMKQMGVHDMIWGRITDKMMIPRNGKLDLSKFIHPRVEPEICFCIDKDIDMVLDEEEVKSHVDGVAAAMEIIDSRYKNFKFSLEDVIADNCSSSGLVIGEWKSPEIDISDLKMDLIIDGETVQSGSSSAILNSPWKSLAAATRLAHQYGEKIEAGMIVMAGAATPAVFLKPGNEVITEVEELGSVKFIVE